MWEYEIMEFMFEVLFPWPIIIFLIVGMWLYSVFSKACEYDEERYGRKESFQHIPCPEESMIERLSLNGPKGRESYHSETPTIVDAIRRMVGDPHARIEMEIPRIERFQIERPVIERFPVEEPVFEPIPFEKPIP